MPRHHRLTIIAKERPFAEEPWKELLIAFAYVLHERRQAGRAPATVEAEGTDAPTPPDDVAPPRQQIGGTP